MSDRVVVTGVGVVSPLGVGVETFWKKVAAGENGIRAITEFDTDGLACKIAGFVPSIEEDPNGFDIDRYIEPKEQKRFDRFIHFAIAAANEALDQSGWSPQTEEEKTRSGTVIASGAGGFPTLTAGTRLIDEKGPRRASPFLVSSFLSNLASGQVSIRHGLKGPIGAPVTACAASLQAIGDAARYIRSGEADVMVAGGTEASIDRISYAAFCAIRAMSSKRNDDPSHACRPFDKDRDGFVMGEGAGVLVLERESHALARGAKILAVLSGYGTTADAHHVTAAPQDGEGGLRAMKLAIQRAGLTPDDIGYVNAHSTSTPIGDTAEIAALATLFAGRGKSLGVSSSKSMFGHLLGGAGAVESIACICALQSGILPPSRNLETPDDVAAQFDLIPHKGVDRQVEHILTNGFGFGGVNASAVFSRVS